ncbi:hypothetical protein [Microbacterium sp. NIBRBAC000506063]|uniref:hypothetical protein n=1 Tax=Microbacterium sp. NIBRBAC000506063 TaxID=2734618 RepID=UPI001BB6AB8D|nr:serine hydrolase [Microbacterium sp. NIBRBAC000506063]
MLAGWIVEQLSGKIWDVAVRERLAEPLGLRRTVTLPEEAILHDVAVGHVGERQEDLRPAPIWALPRSIGPAGPSSPASETF